MDTFGLPTTEPNLKPYIITAPVGMLNIPVPFAAPLDWVFDGYDALWIARGERYSIVKQKLTGDTIRIIEVERLPEAVSESERLEARARITSLLLKVGADASQVDFSRIPTNRPVHGRIHLDDKGRLWVARLPTTLTGAADTLSTVYDVFGETGRHIGVVSLDISPTSPLAFSADRVGGVYRDELGVEEVVVYRLGSIQR